MEKAWVEPSSLNSALIDLALKRGSLSEIILSGSPYLGKKFDKNILAMSSAVAVLVVGIKIAPFESPWSTMDNMVSTLLPSCVREGGKSVIKSMAICENGLVDVGGSIGFRAGFEGCRLILFC